MVFRSLLNWLKPRAKQVRRPRVTRLDIESLEDRRTPTAWFSIGDVTIDEGNSGTVNAIVPVTLTGSHGNGTSVNYRTSGDYALPGSDFTAVSGKLTFAKNETTKSIVIPIKGDRVMEDHEYFNVILSNAKGAKISNGTSYVTIVDDEPYAHIGYASATEGNAGTGTMEFMVSLTSEYDLPVTIDFTTTDGTAIAGSDYVAASSSLVFAPGETSKPIQITTIGDRIGEPAEYFNVYLSTQDSYAGAGNTVGYGTIYDNEPQISISDSYLNGSTFTFTVTLIGDHDEIVNVDFTTVDETAIAGTDYAAKVGTLTFGLNENSQTIVIAVIDPLAYDKYFSIQLSNATSSAYFSNATAYAYWYYDSGYYDYGYYYWDYYYYGWY